MLVVDFLGSIWIDNVGFFDVFLGGYVGFGGLFDFIGKGGNIVLFNCMNYILMWVISIFDGFIVIVRFLIGGDN